MKSIGRRNAGKFPIYIHAFWLQILALIGLTTSPAWADANILNGDHQVCRQPQPQSSEGETKSIPFSIGPGTETLLAIAEFPVLDEAERKKKDKSDRKAEDKEDTTEPVTRKLPIWGEQARQMGFELPLPFGMGVNYTFINQGINIRNLKVGIGSPDIEVEGLKFHDARSRDSAVTARLDMWLLPFINLYGLFGSITGEAELDLDVSQIIGGLPPGLPAIFEPNKTIDLNIDYSGFTFGGGMTLAGGYESFFGSLDTNYTYSTVNVANSKIDTVTVTPRLGLMVNPPEIKGAFALWIGAMYMRYKQTISDDISLQKLDPRLPPAELAYKLDIKNDSPWSILLGGQWEITKRLQIMAEGGAGGRRQLVTGISYRF